MDDINILRKSKKEEKRMKKDQRQQMYDLKDRVQEKKT